MFRKPRCLLFGLVLAMPAPVNAQESQIPRPLDGPDLQRYVVEVLQENAGLAAAGLRSRAAAERVEPAGALPDPTFSTGIMAVPITSFDFEREAMTRFPIGLQQRFPFPGKQAAGSAVARGARDVAIARVERVESALAAEAASAYFRLAFARSAVEIWRARLGLAEQAVRVARSRYGTGRAEQADLLRAELRRARLVEAGHGFSGEVESALARLDALRGGPGDPVTVPALTVPDAPALRAVLADTLAPLDSLRRQLVSANPDLAVAAAEVERARAADRAASVAARPDFTFGLSLDPRLGGREPFLTSMVGISIPLWAARKQAPAARAAGLELEGAGQRREDLRARLEAELRDRVAQLEALRRRIGELGGEVLPLAEAASGSALRSYSVGAVELTAVLDSQDELFEVRLELARLIAEYGARRAALSALLGEEWY